MFNQPCPTRCLSDVRPGTLGECRGWADSADRLTLPITVDLQALPLGSELLNLSSSSGVCREGLGRLCQGTQCPRVSRVQL